MVCAQSKVLDWIAGFKLRPPSVLLMAPIETNTEAEGKVTWETCKQNLISL